MSIDSINWNIVYVRSRLLVEPISFNIEDEIQRIRTSSELTNKFSDKIPFKVQPASEVSEIIRETAIATFLTVIAGADTERIPMSLDHETLSLLRSSQIEKPKSSNSQKFNSVNRSIQRAIISLCSLWMRWTGMTVPKSNEYVKGLKDLDEASLCHLPLSYQFIIAIFEHCKLPLRSSHIINEVSNIKSPKNNRMSFTSMTKEADEPFDLSYPF